MVKLAQPGKGGDARPPPCLSKIFRHGNKNTLSLVMLYSALFNNVIQALNLFLNKYVAAWQWHSATLHTTEVLHRVLPWLGIKN
jgi:hypothetical protein